MINSASQWLQVLEITQIWFNFVVPKTRLSSSRSWSHSLCDKKYITERTAQGFQLNRNEPRHDKTNKMCVRPAKTHISLGIRPVWSESSLSAWRKLWSLATHQAHSEDSDQTGQTPRLIWVFAGRTITLLVLSCRGSNIHGWLLYVAAKFYRK